MIYIKFVSKPSPTVAELRKALLGGWKPTLRFFDWAASISETPEYTSTADLIDAVGAKPLESKELVDGIVKLGLARFVVGRRRSPSRLIWQYSLASIAAAARSQADRLIAVDHGGLARIAPQDMLEHPFQLRRDCRVSVALPSDLTKKEAARFAAFIETLPFEN